MTRAPCRRRQYASATRSRSARVTVASRGWGAWPASLGLCRGRISASRLAAAISDLSRIDAACRLGHAGLEQRGVRSHDWRIEPARHLGRHAVRETDRARPALRRARAHRQRTVQRRRVAEPQLREVECRIVFVSPSVSGGRRPQREPVAARRPQVRADSVSGGHGARPSPPGQARPDRLMPGLRAADP